MKYVCVSVCGLPLSVDFRQSEVVSTWFVFFNFLPFFVNVFYTPSSIYVIVTLLLYSGWNTLTAELVAITILWMFKHIIFWIGAEHAYSTSNEREKMYQIVKHRQPIISNSKIHTHIHRTLVSVRIHVYHTHNTQWRCSKKVSYFRSDFEWIIRIQNISIMGGSSAKE